MAFIKWNQGLVALTVVVASMATGCGSKFSQLVDGRHGAQSKDGSGSGGSVAATTFTTSDGKTVQIGAGAAGNAAGDASDKPKVLVFASMMCAGCKKEAQLLVKEFADPNSALHKAEILHLIIGTDEEVGAFKAQNQISWGAAKASMQQLNEMCGELPPCTVVEHKGRVLLKHEGELKDGRDAAHPGSSLQELLEIIETAASGVVAGAGNAANDANGPVAGKTTDKPVAPVAPVASGCGSSAKCDCAVGLQAQIDDLNGQVKDLNQRIDQNKCQCKCQPAPQAPQAPLNPADKPVAPPAEDPVDQPADRPTDRPDDGLTPPPAQGDGQNGGQNDGQGDGNDIPPAFDEPATQPPVTPPVVQPSQPTQPSLPALDSSRYVTGTIQGFDGKEIAIESLRGEKLVVIFSGPDCGNCRTEVQHLNAELANPNSRLHGAKIVQIFFLNTQMGHTHQYASQKANSWGVRWTSGSANTWDIFSRYNAQCNAGMMPCTIVQDPSRGIVNSYDGREASAADLIRDLGL